MIDWTKRVMAGSLLGAVIGVALGLVLARALWPAAAAPVTPAAIGSPAPSATAAAGPDEDTDRALVMIAGLYALDGNVGRARERLAALGVDGAPEALAGLALRYGSGGRTGVATDLATLAAALGYPAGTLLAYVATATAPPTLTPTHTPSPTVPPPTATPTPTDTPPPTATPTATATRRPAAPKATAAPTQAPAPAESPREEYYDQRVFLLEPPVKVQRASVAPGQLYWRLVRLEWRKAGEGGSCLIYVTTFNQAGQPSWNQPVIVEHGPAETLYTTPKAGEPYGANYFMTSTLNSYIVFIGGDHPSDRVAGLGLGEWYGGLDHTSFVLEFQLVGR